MTAARSFCLLALTLGACSDAPNPVFELTGSAMGTTYSVQLAAPVGDDERESLRQEIAGTLDTLEAMMSTYSATSELSMVNASDSTDWILVSEDLCRTVAIAQSVSRLSDGAFDVTVGPLVNLWGFGPDGSAKSPPDSRQIVDTLSKVGYERLHTDCEQPAVRKGDAGLYIDLSGVAKGYAADRLAGLLDARELHDYLIEIGGEMRMRGINGRREKWAIAIESPERGLRSVQTIVGLTDVAIATSGDYRNYFEYDGQFYSHTIDPRTGKPVHHGTASVTAVADNAAFADAIATALLVLGSDTGLELAEKHGIAALFILRRGDGVAELASSQFHRKTKYTVRTQ